jgi:hypothetical protein
VLILEIKVLPEERLVLVIWLAPLWMKQERCLMFAPRAQHAFESKECDFWGLMLIYTFWGQWVNLYHLSNRWLSLILLDLKIAKICKRKTC